MRARIRFPVGKIADKVGRRIPLILSQALIALVFLSFSKVRSVVGLTLTFALYGVGWGATAVVGSTQIQDNVPSLDRGVASELQGIFFDFGGAFGSVVAGIIATTVATPTIFRFSTLIPLIGLLAATMMIRRSDSS